MLKKVINNSDPISKGALSKQPVKIENDFKPSQTSKLLFDCIEIAHNLYIFRAQDFDHDLSCEMTLELSEGFAISGEDIEEQKYLVPIMTCNFPSIDVSRFNENVSFDEYLQGILMFQFQLKILDQLFLFCESKDAVNLTLTFNKYDHDYLTIYSRFFVFEEQVITSKGVQTKIVIQTDVGTYDDVIDFMDDVHTDLRQTLWRDQKANPSFRKYLINHYLSVH